MNRISSAIMLMLLLSVSGLCIAQNSAPDASTSQALPLNQEEPKHPEGVPAQTPETAPEPRPQKEKPAQKEEKPEQREKQKEPKSQEQPKAGHEEHGKTTQREHPRPAGKSAHIPDPKFKANFGRQHAFKVNQVITTTTIVPNQTQFVYSGYTFIFLDPWPAGWLFADDCYVDFIDDEYFLIDVFHPGVRVALFVVG
jgi:hypothetical protein